MPEPPPAAIPAPSAVPPPVPAPVVALPPVLEWSFNPWQQNWRRPAALLVICLAFAALAGFTTVPNGEPQAIGWGVISFALLLGMNALVVLPVRYRLDAEGVTVWFLGVPSARPWAHYRNAYFHRSLVHLTTLPRPSALDPFRGHSLQFNPSSPLGQRSLVQPFIERQLEPYRKAAPE